MSTRPSLLRIATRSFPVLFGLILVLFGVPFLYVAFSTGTGEPELRTSGVVGQGTITDKRIERETRIKKGGGLDVRTKYLLRYRFATQTGNAVDGEQAVSEKTWNSLEPNAKAAVRYVPGNPALNRLDAEARSGEIVPLAVGGVAVLGGAILFMVGTIRARRVVSLLRNGRPVQAKIVKMDGRTVRGRTSYVIHYSYEDAEGRTYNGKSLPMTDKDASGWKAGDTGRARIDASHPAFSAWVGEDD
jgi:hypothetical protein